MDFGIVEDRRSFVKGNGRRWEKGMKRWVHLSDEEGE